MSHSVEHGSLFGVETEVLLASIVDSSSDAILGQSPTGTLTTWNRGAERMFGYSSEEIIGKPVRVLIQADRQDEMELILARVQNGERVEHYQTVRVRKDGSAIAISLTVSPILNSSRKLVHISSIAREITETKRTEESAIKERECLAELERFKTLTVGRELKMIELKRELAELERELVSLRPQPAAPRAANA